MRLQHVSVLFILIFIPIILVTSYFISLQVNTIKIESDYDEKLLNATYDAMTAFELNTANEDLSSVSDSLRSIIDASNNIFFNTLCTNLGVSNASKSYVQPYIPAILYTLYDGYYIYSPTNIPEICVDKYGRTIRTSDYGVTFQSIKNGVGIYEFNQASIIYSTFTPTEPAENPATEGDVLQTAPSVNYTTLDSSIKSEYGQILYKNNDGTYSTKLHTWTGGKNTEEYKKSTYYKRDYILKSYIPYSATYSTSNIDITINYTLDNFMTIEGRIDGVYYTKSGYFIDQNLVKTIVVDGVTVNLTQPFAWGKYSEEVLDDYIHHPESHTVTVTLNDDVTISNIDGRVPVSNGIGAGSEVKYWDDAQSAVEYYIDSYIFSCWVHENLNGLQGTNLKNAQYSVTDIQNTVTQNVNGQTALYKDMLHDFSTDTNRPFIGNDNDPESEESKFYKHKRNVIKNSITYNLILSMLVYTEESRTVEFNMPVLAESEWDRILNNVSIISFMQGMRCGLKYYNNYAIVTSTNNEISVTNNEIYYVPRTLQEIDAVTHAQIISGTADDYVYEIAHRIDCNELILGETDNFYSGVWLGCISFKSKEIKYDKILNAEGKYDYDHKVYTDYDCIVDSNYRVKNITNTYEDGNTDILDYLLRNATAIGTVPDTALRDHLKWKLAAYRIAIAKERNNLYKTTAFAENYGWQSIYKGDKDSGTKKNSGSNFVDVDLSSLSRTELKEIKKIEVTIENTQIKDTSGNQIYGVYTDSITASFGSNTYSTPQTISTTSTSRRTLEFVQDFDSGDASTLTLETGNSNTSFTVEAVKVYYK